MRLKYAVDWRIQSKLGFRDSPAIGRAIALIYPLLLLPYTKVLYMHIQTVI
jgi:hypothetical protein